MRATLQHEWNILVVGLVVEYIMYIYKFILTFSTLIEFFKLHFAILRNMDWLLKITYCMHNLHYVLIITLWDDHYTMTFVMSLCNEILHIVIPKSQYELQITLWHFTHVLIFQNTFWVLKIQHENKKHNLCDGGRLVIMLCISKTQHDIISFTV